MFNFNISINKIPIMLIILLSTLWIIYSSVFANFQYTFGLLFSIFYIAFFILFKTEQKFYWILFTLPFASLFKVNDNLPSTLVVLYLIYIVHVLIKNRNQIPLFDFIIISFIITLQIISTTLYNGSYFSVISFLVNIIFMRVVIQDLITVHDNNKPQVLFNSTVVFSFSMIMSIFIADIHPNIPYIVLEGKQTLLMSINRFSGLNGDPNYYSQLILIAISLIVAATIKTPNKLVKILLLVIGGYLAVNGFRSMSKSYALSIIALLILGLYYLNIHKREFEKFKEKYIRVARSFFIFITGIVALFFIINNIVIPLIESRTDAEDFFTGREEIWWKYINLLILYPEILITGVGFSNDANILGKVFGIFHAPHNVYIELLVNCGFLGLILLVCLFRILFFNLKDLIKSPLYIYIALFLLTSLSISLSSNDAFFILIPLMVLVKKNKKIEV